MHDRVSLPPLIRHGALLLLASAALGACGDDGYTAEERTKFVESCDEQSASTSRSVCECAFEELERTLPYEHFEAAEEAVRAGDPPAAEFSTKLTAAVERCVE